jgi:hypothetical protein
MHLDGEFIGQPLVIIVQEGDPVPLRFTNASVTRLSRTHGVMIRDVTNTVGVSVSLEDRGGSQIRPIYHDDDFQMGIGLG